MANKYNYIKENWQPILVGVVAALLLIRLLELIESVIIKIALI